MAVKTYGNIYLNDNWIIDQAEPHICIRLKNIFQKIDKTKSVPFVLANTPENCHDILWFMDRYPLAISDSDLRAMKKGSNKYVNFVNELARINLPGYVTREIILNPGELARHYQVTGAEIHHKVKKLLLADDLGLGKTLTGVLTLLYPDSLPAIVVTPSHLTTHWQAQIERFTNLRVHKIKSTTPYSLPEADVYLSRYTCLAGWSDVHATGFYKSAIFDEVQDLRHTGTNKYWGARTLVNGVGKVLALSATPIYNYGSEIFNILNLINEGCLGTAGEFFREWCKEGIYNGGKSVKVDDPHALGTYLREKHIMVRRTRAEVGRELPPINKLIYTVGHDEKAVQKEEDRAIQLALQTTQGTFLERGEASLELSVFVRRLTGISKARDVAAYVKILLENGEPVVLAGWHRDVYDIWKDVLKEYKPVFYTGTESPHQKDEAVRKFLAAETNLFIISLRSGVGLDGLQKRCKCIVYGELDYSPKVHNQVTARIDRDGQQEQVTEIFCVSDWGSDPVIIDILGIKSSQSHGILNPEGEIMEQFSDESWIKTLAQNFLNKANLVTT